MSLRPVTRIGFQSTMAGVVILYHPDEFLEERIHSYLFALSKLYIIDNSENKSFEFKTLSLDKCQYIHDNKNEGIARRLNEAVSMAKNDGFQWLLTMDQDSSFTPENLKNYVTCIEKFPEKSSVALFGLQYENPELQSDKCHMVDCTQVITSGSFLNLNLIHQNGGFDENLFIDQVDLEYCYRSIRKGSKVIKVQNVYLEHKLGNITTHTSLRSLGRTRRSLHSPVRLYYMTRNYFYVKAKYKEDFPREIRNSRKDLLIRIKNNLLYNKQRFSVIRYLLKAVFDYSTNRMGKLSH